MSPLLGSTGLVSYYSYRGNIDTLPDVFSIGADVTDVDVARAAVSVIPCTVVVEELCAEIAVVTSESVAADVFALNKFAISLILLIRRLLFLYR